MIQFTALNRRKKKPSGGVHASLVAALARTLADLTAASLAQ
jgi:hypothetical protein